jgi:hypothetical protein
MGDIGNTRAEQSQFYLQVFKPIITPSSSLQNPDWNSQMLGRKAKLKLWPEWKGLWDMLTDVCTKN